MQLFISQVANGIGSGVVYASVALALVLIFRTTGLLNFAQGEMAMFATFFTWWLTDQGLKIGFAIIISMALSFVGGAIIERVVIRPVESANNPLNVVIVTLGLFLAFGSLAQLIFGTDPQQMPSPFPSGRVFSGYSIQKSVLGFALVLVAECVLLYLLFQHTRIGLALRAVASNPESSRLIGINTGHMLMLGWALAAALGTLAGALVATKGTGFDASLMQEVLVYAFAAAALGGFDSPIGAVVGGLIVGVAQSLTVEYVDALDGIEVVVPFALILLVLLVKPNGLFGRTIVERV